MLKVLAFISLLVLLSTVACAAMTLEDYAEECGEWNDDYGDLFGRGMSYSFSISDMEDGLDEWNALSPPGDVGALHDIRAEAYQLFLDNSMKYEALQDRIIDLQDDLDDARRSQRDAIRDQMDDLGDEQEDLLEDLWDEMEDLDDDYQDAIDDLPRSAERELENEGCI